jgi:hypothetical protein
METAKDAALKHNITTARMAFLMALPGNQVSN